MKKILFYTILFCVYTLASIPVGLFLYTVKSNKDINIFSNSGFHAYAQCLDHEFKKIIGAKEELVLQLTEKPSDVVNFNYDSYMNFYERIGALIQVYEMAKNKKEIERILMKDGVSSVDKKWVKEFPDYLKYEKEFFDLQKDAESFYFYHHRGTLAYSKPWHIYVFYDKNDVVQGMYYESYNVPEMIKLLRDVDQD